MASSSEPQPAAATLTASEFTAILNGENPQAILRTLKDFARTVKRERRTVLGSAKGNKDVNDVDADHDEDDDDDDDDSMDEHNERDNNHEAESPEPPRKKYKEAWQEDTQSYNVPFVGTAVARGEQAPLVPGQWPTGLVDVYLQKSPLVIELTSPDLLFPQGPMHKRLVRKKQGQLSRSIAKAHLAALAELLTAAIPRGRLVGNEDPFGDSTSRTTTTTTIVSPPNPAFLNGIWKTIVPWILEILNDETGKGRGKTGAVGGCGSLAGPALAVLRRLAQVSVQIARTVTRQLDEKLSDGVLRICLRPLGGATVDATAAAAATKSVDDDATPRSKPSRIEAIRLATCLLDMKDGAVVASIGTSGNRERKIKAGILYVALREGLALPSSRLGKTESHHDDRYLGSVANMLQSVRQLVFGNSGPNTRRLGSTRLLHDMLSRDPLTHLCRLSSHAPRLSSQRTYQDVLIGEDAMDDDVALLERVGSEARRLLLPLLSQSTSSPLLLRSEYEQVARAMIKLLNSSSFNLELRSFLVYCTVKNNMLVRDVMRSLVLPDPKKPLDYIFMSRFITAIFRNGPGASSCLSPGFAIDSPQKADDALSVIVPLKIRGGVLTRALQVGDPIVRLESLKMIISFLERFEMFRKDYFKMKSFDEEFADSLVSMMTKALPDLHAILSLRTKLDWLQTGKAGALLTLFLFRAVENYVNVLPTVINEINFDWMKIVPDETAAFHKALPAVQLCLLRCLSHVVNLRSGNVDNMLLSARPIFDVMVSTRNPTVHNVCRAISLNLLERSLQPEASDIETSSCIEYEVSVWVDALRPSNLSSFFRVLQEGLHNSLKYVASPGRAWMHYNVRRRMNFSVVLCVALLSDRHSETFSSLVTQVCTRCLLYLKDPLPLAAFIASINEVADEKISSKKLRAYAIELLNFNLHSTQRRSDKLEMLLSSVFSKDDVHLRMLQRLKEPDGDASENNLAGFTKLSLHSNHGSLIKFLNHLSVILGANAGATTGNWTLLRTVLPLLLLDAESSRARKRVSSILADVHALQENSRSTDFHQINILVLSSPWSKSIDFTRSKFAKQVGSLFHVVGTSLDGFDQRYLVLCLYLLENRLTETDKARIGVGLTYSKTNESSVGFLRFAGHFLESSVLKDQLHVVEHDEVTLKSAVNAWVCVGRKAKQSQGRSIERRVRASLGALLSTILEKRGVEATAVLVSFDGLLGDVVDLCLDLSVEDDSWTVMEIHFFSLIFSCDHHRLFDQTLERLRNMGSRLTSAWERGMLDVLFGQFVLETRSNSHLRESLVKVLFPLVLQRVSNILTKGNCDDVPALVDLMCHIVDSKPMLADVEVLAKDVSRSLESTRDSPVSLGACKLGVCVLRYFDTFEREVTTTVETLQSYLLRHLCSLLPTTLKGRTTKEPETQRKDHLSWMIYLLSGTRKFDSQIARTLTVTEVLKAIKSCLKQGIVLETTGNSVAMLSLQLVDFIIHRAMAPNSGLSIPLPPLSDIFGMITTHSKFELIFSEEDDASRKGVAATKEALLKLMISCVQLSSKEVTIQPTIWSLLLSSFDAGTTRLDNLIRFLIAVTAESCLPFMDEFRWRGCAMANDQGQSQNRWDWLLDAITPSRVRATVAHFPIEDSMVVQRGIADADENEQTRHAVLRYSPAFLLPLILGSLEALLQPYLTNEYKKAENDGGRTVFSKSSTIPIASIAAVQRLCDKGTISLCLSSLCSKCESVRKYALAVLGFILKICQAQESRDYSSWRDRPQMAMMLNSIQRFLVLHLARTEISLESTSTPKLTPIVATFLARAAFAVSKPDDGLYVAINKFFLKSDTDHGAFQDSNRLPGFISLFCASTEDSEQARVERLWALYLLRDGLLDEHSYRLVAACHAPELILSAFENVGLSRFSGDQKDTEYNLLLECLISMLDYGVYSAHNHLLGRLGLLSWMRSWCECKSLEATFRSTKTRTTFFRLARSSIQAAVQAPRLRTSVLVSEACGMIQPLLSLLLLADSTPATDFADARLLETGIAALDDIQTLLKSLKEDEGLTCPVHQPLGASIFLSVQLLSLLLQNKDGKLTPEHEVITCRALNTLCKLPVAVTNNWPCSSLVKKFVVLSLRCCAELDEGKDHADNEWIVSVLRRVLDMVEICNEQKEVLPLTKDYLYAIRCRYAFFSTGPGIDLWREVCGQLLTAND